MALKIDWQNLGFAYMQTDCYMRSDFKNGSWGDLVVATEPMMPLHIAATSVHYGQACFEGLKAFSNKNGSVSLFRPEENARRMNATAVRLVMEPLPEELFIEACRQVVLKNLDYMPPYGYGSSMYVRPLLIGSGARIGVQPSDEYTFLVLCMPVGPYYKNGFYPVKALVQEQYDRAAPRGVGNVKAAGNYAAGMKSEIETKKAGYSVCLYLDAATHTYVDEFGTSNFIGITKDNRFVAAASNSILPSITNKSLQVLAADLGLEVERRPVRLDELENFAEIGACGTAAVITPVYSLTHGNRVYTFGSETESGPVLTRLFKELQGIQFGEIEDKYGWMVSAG